LVDYYFKKGLLKEIDNNREFNNTKFNVINDCKKFIDEIGN
jgi:hypothetical protein